MFTLTKLWRRKKNYKCLSIFTTDGSWVLIEGSTFLQCSTVHMSRNLPHRVNAHEGQSPLNESSNTRVSFTLRSEIWTKLFLHWPFEVPPERNTSAALNKHDTYTRPVSSLGTAKASAPRCCAIFCKAELDPKLGLTQWIKMVLSERHIYCNVDLQ